MQKKNWQNPISITDKNCLKVGIRVIFLNLINCIYKNKTLKKLTIIINGEKPKYALLR